MDPKSWIPDISNVILTLHQSQDHPGQVNGNHDSYILSQEEAISACKYSSTLLLHSHKYPKTKYFIYHQI